MQGIEFEDDKNMSGISAKAPQVPVGKQSFMMKLLEKMGITDKATANFILLGIAVVFFAITIYLYAGVLGGSGKSHKLTPEQMQAQLKLMQGVRTHQNK